MLLSSIITNPKLNHTKNFGKKKVVEKKDSRKKENATPPPREKTEEEENDDVGCKSLGEEKAF